MIRHMILDVILRNMQKYANNKLLVPESGVSLPEQNLHHEDSAAVTILP